MRALAKAALEAEDNLPKTIVTEERGAPLRKPPGGRRRQMHRLEAQDR